MKSIRYIAALTLAIGVLSCDKKQDTTPTTEENVATTTNISKAAVEIAPENIDSTSFKIEGMTCQMGCANTIQTKLESLEGVSKAIVSFDEGNAKITFDKTVQNTASLKKTVNEIADGKLYKAL